jgi:hypothetical protein
MNAFWTIISSADFWKVALPALAAVAAWYFNERSKLQWEQFKRKEENYKELLRCLKGFYTTTADQALEDQFLHQVNLCWLYAPDPVIHAAYAFLATVHTGAKTTDAEKELVCGRLVQAIRSDLLSRKIVTSSRLEAQDFKHLIATKVQN